VVAVVPGGAVDAPVDVVQPAADHGPIVRARSGGPRLTELASFVRGQQERAQCPRERAGVAGRHQPRAAGRADQRFVPFDAAGHDRLGARHRFEEHDPETFAAEGRRADDVGGLKVAGQVGIGNLAGELHCAGITGERAERRTLRSGSDDHQQDIGRGLSNERHRPDKRVDAFAWFEPAHAQDRPPSTAQCRWTRPRAPKIVHVDPVRDDLVGAGKMGRHRAHGGIRHRNACAQTADERAERAFPDRIQPMARFAVHMERADERRARGADDQPWHERRQRFVNVNDVERSACEPAHGGEAAWIDAKPRFRAAKRDEDRTPQRVFAVRQWT